MFFCEEEKAIMRNLFRHINEVPDEVYTLKLQDGSVLKAKADTCYESDNDLNEEDENYREFNVCAMRIVEIIKRGRGNTMQEEELIEVNYLNYPESLKTSTGKQI